MQYRMYHDETKNWGYRSVAQAPAWHVHGPKFDFLHKTNKQKTEKNQKQGCI